MGSATHTEEEKVMSKSKTLVERAPVSTGVQERAVHVSGVPKDRLDRRNGYYSVLGKETLAQGRNDKHIWTSEYSRKNKYSQLQRNGIKQHL